MIESTVVANANINLEIDEIIRLSKEVMTETEKCKNIQLFIDKDPNNCIKQYDQGKNALHLACEYGLVHVVQILIKHQWPLNDKDDLGNTALHIAVAAEISHNDDIQKELHVSL